MPLPLLRSLTRQYRDTGAHYGDEDAVSVTQLIAPIQQQRLLQRHDIYVDPLDNLWALLGTLTHAILEDEAQQTVGAEDDDDRLVAEQKLVQEFDALMLGGTIDLLESECNEGAAGWHGSDYKLTSAYSVKKMMKEGVYQGAPDRYWQAQLYAYMAGKAGYEPMLSWGVVAICRDWSERMHGAVCGPVEVIDVPLLAPERVENYLKQRIMLWKASAMAEDAGLPSCSDEETWGGRRCASYCAAADVCHQVHPEWSIDVRTSY